MEARPKGTTAIMEDLFHTLPVRHKEFTKTIKRQYGKMLNTIQAYALMVRGVKFTLTSIVGNMLRLLHAFLYFRITIYFLKTCTFRNITLNEHISMSFRDEITFQSALESSESILFNENDFKE